MDTYIAQYPYRSRYYRSLLRKLTIKDVELTTGKDWVVKLKGSNNALTIKDMVHSPSGHDTIDTFKFEGGESYTTTQFLKALGIDSTVNHSLI